MAKKVNVKELIEEQRGSGQSDIYHAKKMAKRYEQIEREEMEKVASRPDIEQYKRYLSPEQKQEVSKIMRERRRMARPVRRRTVIKRAPPPRYYPAPYQQPQQQPQQQPSTQQFLIQYFDHDRDLDGITDTQDKEVPQLNPNNQKRDKDLDGMRDDYEDPEVPAIQFRPKPVGMYKIPSYDLGMGMMTRRQQAPPRKKQPKSKQKKQMVQQPRQFGMMTSAGFRFKTFNPKTNQLE